MDTKQTNRTNMFKTVDTYLESRSAVWNTMAPLANAVQSFRDTLKEIDSAAQQQETPSGAVDMKAAARDALEEVMFLTCEAMGVLAHTNGDHDLLALTDLSRSDLVNLTAAELVNRATTVLAQANTHKTELAAMQVTQANLDEFAQALAGFGDAKEQPRAATAERMAQRQSLRNLIRQANGILRDEIDRLVNLFSRSNPDFVAGYRAARVVVDRAARHGSTPAQPSPPLPNP